MTVSADRPIQDRAAFDAIRYGSVWEDADVLCEALAPPAAGGRVLSVASAGDNALALLTLDPTEVVAVDLSPAQLACLALRMQAFSDLDDEVLLPFLGVEPSNDRIDIYRRLRRGLPDDVRAFWDERSDLVANGIIRAGKFEAYFRTFRRRVLPLVHSRANVERLLEPREREARRAFYDRVWDGWRWRLLFRLFFGRWAMGRLGRDPAFFEHVDGPVAERILKRSRYALTELTTHDNPYLTCILTGRYGTSALPRYLRPQHRDAIRDRLPRLRMHLGPIEEVDGEFTAFNLSDIFEYMSPEVHERAYGALLERARPGARLVYWNLLADRAAPTGLGHRVVPLRDLAERLHAEDRAWFYDRLHVDEVLPYE